MSPSPLIKNFFKSRQNALKPLKTEDVGEEMVDFLEEKTLNLEDIGFNYEDLKILNKLFKDFSVFPNPLEKESTLKHLEVKKNVLIMNKDQCEPELLGEFDKNIKNLSSFSDKINEFGEKEFDILNEHFARFKENNKEEKETPYYIFEKEAQAKEFIKNQPLFFDKKELWWLWNKKELKWEITDKTEILNGIKKIGINTINSKERTEIINALQQTGRENTPKELNKKCIQFKNKIINLKTDEEFKPIPKYFSTNPISWEIGESEETPTMDKYFKEWVGEKYVQTLYEIIAYSSCSEQFMQRMIALVGGGSNGKGTYIKLLKKFVGKDNCSSSELGLISSNQFETSMIYKKLLCEMGEVSYDDLKSTNQIKKLSGEDDIRYCFKGKTPFSEESPTTCIINTNSLPNTPDKTIGFYRRWLIVDFPNQFEIKSGLIEQIPKQEFKNLARKVIRILKELYQTQRFSNEGDFEERTKRYEERSNPVMRFVEKYCDEEIENYISLKNFSKKLNEYLIEKHLRKISPKEIKKKLQEEGFDVRKSTKFGVQDTYVFCLNLKNPLIPFSKTSISRKGQIEEKGINGINGIKKNISKENNSTNTTNPTSNTSNSSVNSNTQLVRSNQNVELTEEIP